MEQEQLIVLLAGLYIIVLAALKAIRSCLRKRMDRSCCTGRNRVDLPTSNIQERHIKPLKLRCIYSNAGLTRDTFLWLFPELCSDQTSEMPQFQFRNMALMLLILILVWFFRGIRLQTIYGFADVNCPLDAHSRSRQLLRIGYL